jgi:sterol desaturase/sphingolipid hydroxylase (fatty acid hydroxylase superfamily)
MLIGFTKKHKNFKKRKLDNSYYTITIMNLIISSIVCGIVLNYYNFSKHLLPKLQNIIFYFIVLDTLFYWTHRTIHKNPTLKQIFHFTHHEAIDLIPMDLFYVDYKEYILYLIIFVFPLLFIDFSFIEYVVVSIITFYHFYYTHSDVKDSFILPIFVNSKYHKKHHTIGRGNYSLFFNIWDEYMDSKIKKKTRLSK